MYLISSRGRPTRGGPPARKIDEVLSKTANTYEVIGHFIWPRNYQTFHKPYILDYITVDIHKYNRITVIIILHELCVQFTA
jgi:hypothetical protein